MVNFGASPPSLLGAPVRIWTPGQPLSPRREAGRTQAATPPLLPGSVPEANVSSPNPWGTMDLYSPRGFHSGSRSYRSFSQLGSPSSQLGPEVGYDLSTEGQVVSGGPSAAAREVRAMMSTAAPKGTLVGKRRAPLIASTNYTAAFQSIDPMAPGRGYQTSKMDKIQKIEINKREDKSSSARNPYRKPPSPRTAPPAISFGLVNDFSLKETTTEKSFREFWKMVQDQEGEMYLSDFWKWINMEQEDTICVAEFWHLVERPKRRRRWPKENLAADFWNLVEGKEIRKRKRHMTYQTVADIAGDFLRMIERTEHRQTKRERKSKEAVAGEFWKMVELTEELRRKKEVMRRLSASKVAASTKSSMKRAPKPGADQRGRVAPPTTPTDEVFAPPAPAFLFESLGGVKRSGAILGPFRGTFFLAKDPEPQNKPPARIRTVSTPSLYSLKEEEETLTPGKPRRHSERVEASSPSGSELSRYKSTPHYDSLQMGAKKAMKVEKAGANHLGKTRRRHISSQQCQKQNMTFLAKSAHKGGVPRSNRIPWVSVTGANNDRKCGKRTW